MRDGQKGGSKVARTRLCDQRQRGGGVTQPRAHHFDPLPVAPPRFLSLITSSKFPPRDDGRFAKAASLAFTAARRLCLSISLARLSAFRPRCDLTRPCKRIRVGIISARPRSGTNVAENMHCVVTFSLSLKRCKSGLLNYLIYQLSLIYVFFRLTPLPSLAAKWTATTWPRRRPSSPRPPAAWGASRSGWARGTRRTPSSATPSGPAGMSIDCQIAKQYVKMCQIIV